MTKLFTHTEEIEHCGECCDCGFDGSWVSAGRDYCIAKKGKTIPDIWGKIPKWCPLEEKNEQKKVS